MIITYNMLPLFEQLKTDLRFHSLTCAKCDMQPEGEIGQATLGCKYSKAIYRNFLKKTQAKPKPKHEKHQIIPARRSSGAHP